MIEKRDFLNFTTISQEEYNDFITEKYINNPKYYTKQKVYWGVLIVFIIYGLVSLLYFYKLRNSYLIRQRHFLLTFIGGISAFISVVIALLPQVMKIPCFMNVFSANILSIFVNSIFLVRSIRVILFYHLNIFKVSSIKKKPLVSLENENEIPVEPNNYLMKISKKINLIIISIITIPTVIAILSIAILYLTDQSLFEKCSFFEAEDAVLSIKNNEISQLFKVIAVAGIMFTLLNIVNAILLYFVKDINKYGMKFECLSVSILVIITNGFNAMLNKMLDKSNANLPPRAILTIFNITKGGKLVYALISLYMFFVSITLPIIHYYKSKSLKNKYFQNPICSIHYFYKVLNTPSLLNELREIAIKEFSVENVLFWENYEILRNMSMEYLLEYRSFSQQETSQTLRSFDFEAIYKQQRMNYYPISPTDDITNSEYSSSLPIPQEIISYYTSFYHMFIDFNGPAVVGLQEKTIKNIINEFCTYPTIGVYDQAAHEVVEMMYHSLYPILLRQNQKHIMNTVK